VPQSKEEEEFGYMDGRMFTLKSFKKMADTFRKKWFPQEPSYAQLEDTYWRIVENGDEAVQVTRIQH
jgi:hypothetical protein